jgi:hypothetical protein
MAIAGRRDFPSKSLRLCKCRVRESSHGLESFGYFSCKPPGFGRFERFPLLARLTPAGEAWAWVNDIVNFDQELILTRLDRLQRELEVSEGNEWACAVPVRTSAHADQVRRVPGVDVMSSLR